GGLTRGPVRGVAAGPWPQGSLRGVGRAVATPHAQRLRGPGLGRRRVRGLRADPRGRRLGHHRGPPILVRGPVDGLEEAAVRPHLGTDVLVPGLPRLRGGPGTQPSFGNPGRWLLRWTLFSPSSRASHML